MSESIRGCGYRKVGSLYLCGEYITVACDRLPLRIGHCPVCGEGIHFSRGFREISPLKLFGQHQPCYDQFRPCFVCDPADNLAYVMMVGSKFYTPESFLEEASTMGISKKIPFIPKNMILGETVVYLAHPKAVEVKEPLAVQAAMTVVNETDSPQMRLLDSEQKPEYALGVFCAFIPKRVEKLIWESEATTENIEALEKRGITAIPVPDGDEKHKVGS